MKSKKVTMLAAALVVAVVALAGIGYAAAYTAKTTSTNDVAQSAYVKVHQDGTGSYGGDWLEKVYFNTVNTGLNAQSSAPEYTYELNKEWVITNTTTVTKTGDTAKTMALISNDLELIIEGTNSLDTKLDLKVSTPDLTPISGLGYRMLLVDGVTLDEGGKITAIGNIVTNGNVESHTVADGKVTWAFSNLTASAGSIAHLYVLLFIEEISTVADPDAHVGFGTAAGEYKVSFDFVVEANDQ